MRRWTLHEGDCMAADWPRVTHVISDAPYDQRTSKNARTIRGAIRNKSAVANEGMGKTRYIPFDGVDPAVVGPRAVEAAERWAIIFCALEQLGRYQDATGDAWIRAGFWHRLGGAPQFTGDRPAQSGEGIAIMHRKGRKRWNNGGHAAYWECPRMATGVQPMAAERAHPTQKPVDLMIRIIEQFTDPDDLILDPFCGSGTTGVAALRTGRRFIGFELSAEYAAVARARLSAEDNDSTFAASRAGQTALFGVKL
jgi:site-specific DNA-methyltransferase (adenine-specific)